MADDDSTTTPGTDEAAGSAAPPRRARRRAASRPAGPPQLSGPTDAAEPQDDGHPQDEGHPRDDGHPQDDGPSAGVPEAEPPAQAQEQPAAEEPGAPVVGDEPEEAASPRRPLSTALLFQAPDPAEAIRRPRRAASRPAGAPAPAEPAPVTPVLAPDPAAAAAEAPEAAEVPDTAEAVTAPRSRSSRTRSARAAAGPSARSGGAEQADSADEGPSGRGRSRRLRSGDLAPAEDDAPAVELPAPVVQAPVDRPTTGLGSPFAVDLGSALDELRAGRTGAAIDDDATDDATDDDEPVDDAVDASGDDADDADDADDDPVDDAAEDEDEGEDGVRSRRARRRRGGRGRRRRSASEADDDLPEDGGDPDASDEPEDGADPVVGTASSPVQEGIHDGTHDGTHEGDEPGDEDDEGAEEDAAGSEGGTRRRRRRRRRSGAGAAAEADEAPDEAEEADEAGPAEGGSRRRRRSRGGSGGSGGGEADDAVTSIKGSTRLEAKRQRRREGRDSGRRPKVISEAEFLARRESVERTMVVRSSPGRTQIAVLEDGVLVEHYVARKQHGSMIGNVYLGKVQNVLPSMEAAFVDIGRGRNAVLYAGEVDWEAAGLSGQAKRIETAMKSGDPVLVQVSKDPMGHKGARLTSQVSLPGRYLVYVPGGSMTGISRKLPDTERARLKRVLREVVPEDGGVIVRTAAEGASEEELRRDVERLVEQWREIEERSRRVAAPTLLHGEPDLTIKVVRDVFNEDFSSLVVDGDDAWGAIRPYIDQIAPDLSSRVVRFEGYPGSIDAFDRYRVDEQIAKALERKVWLPSGGSLVIDRTEAMTVVDVNTGRFTGAGGNLEETVTRNNLEAAEEIVRQLRLRDIGGIVVVDFIDMVLESNRDLVLRRLVECLGRDRTKHQVAEVTSLGLVQMTRKRVGQGLLESFSETCEHCHGRGVLLHPEPVEPSRGDGEGPGGYAGPAGGMGGGREGGGRGRRGRGSGGGSGGGAGGDTAAGQGSAADAAGVEDEAERVRLEAARDAVRDAIHGVALASKLVPAPGESEEPAVDPAADPVEQIADLDAAMDARLGPAGDITGQGGQAAAAELDAGPDGASDAASDAGLEPVIDTGREPVIDPVDEAVAAQAVAEAAEEAATDAVEALAGEDPDLV